MAAGTVLRVGAQLIVLSDGWRIQFRDRGHVRGVAAWRADERPGWTEVRRGDDPPIEQPDGPRFHPRQGASESGGPSNDLKQHLGIGRHARTLALPHEELMVKLFMYYFDDEVMQLLVDRNNAHAEAATVRGWRPLSVGEM